MKASYRDGVEIVGYARKRAGWLAPKQHPTIEVTHEALLKALGVEGVRITGATVSKNGTLRLTFAPVETWPKCVTCGEPFWPTKSKRQVACCRNHARRARYAAKSTAVASDTLYRDGTAQRWAGAAERYRPPQIV